MNRSEGTFECAEELFLSSLTDVHSSRVCVIITDGWAWSLAWRQLGVEFVPSLPFSQLAGLQLKELSGRLDGVLEVSQVPNQVDVISGHATNWTNLWSKTLLKLLRPFLEKRGFMVYCGCTYYFIPPNIKGIHLSLEVWRPNKYVDGWQCEDDPDPMFAAAIEEKYHIPEILLPNIDEEPPETVQLVDRVLFDMQALDTFLNLPSHIMIILHPVMGTLWLAYGFGDASGEGRGGQLDPTDLLARIEITFWCTEDSEKSSNNREMKNCYKVHKREAKALWLTGREVWLCTDNEVAERAYYKGLSSSKDLFEIILKIRLLAIKFQFLLHLPQLSGTRMIQSGGDGLSRGEIILGQLQTPVEELMIFHRSLFERMPSLLDWLSTWILTPFRVTEPEYWFYNAHQSDTLSLPAKTETWAWNLHPGAALDALEELGQTRLNCHGILMGVVIIPKSLRPEWFRRFIKIVDLYFFITAGAIEQWPSNIHEGFTIGLYFPLQKGSL
jgi:hypothetical protein